MRRPNNFQNSKKSKYHKTYWNLINKLNKKGIKVFHRPMKKYYGLCFFWKNTIDIASHISGTKFGLMVLLHEYSHCLHQKNRRYYGYYYSNGNYNPKLACRAEWNCWKFAENKLKGMGMNTNHKYLNKKWSKKHFLPLYSGAE